MSLFLCEIDINLFCRLIIFAVVSQTNVGDVRLNGEQLEKRIILIEYLHGRQPMVKEILMWGAELLRGIKRGERWKERVSAEMRRSVCMKK